MLKAIRCFESVLKMIKKYVKNAFRKRFEEAFYVMILKHLVTIVIMR